MRQSRAIACVIACLALSSVLSSCSSIPGTKFVTGTRVISIQSGERIREYWLHTPESNREQSQPLVIALHGTGSDGQQMLKLGDFINHSNEQGYVVAAPNSLGRAFNEGSGRSGPDAADVNDVLFIEEIIDDIKRHASIAPKQVFVTGFSSGGSMAQRIALESKSDISAIASVSGHLWAPARESAVGRSLLLIFGDEDPLNPVEGGPVRYRPELMLDKPAHRVTANQWAKRLGCLSSNHASADVVTRRSWHDCTNDVQLVFLTVEGLGHFWPGGPVTSYDNLDASVTGPYQGKMNATPVVWEFFRDNIPEPE